MILVIGDLRGGKWRGDASPAPAEFRFAQFADLSGDLLADVRPEMILSALMGHGFDAMDLARTLSRLGFRGLYRALTPPLPDPKAVREEIRGVAPGLDFDLLIVDPQVH